ncbi:MAG: septal ring lytic transglycosylase RlpA family protein [Nitrospirae bacterium]|nr:septal ring lytic transglycosylase RlpA family protein [Nitrospirota bacterium]
MIHDKKLFNLHRASCIVYLCILLVLTSCSTTKYESRHKTSPIESKLIVASWYGSDFHGKPTSSGEPFNMYANTCAHKEYPFGTRLRVTNISNDRSTECTVNDRGPFIAGRDLDLSYACAKEIGLIGTGTGKVRIDYIGRDTGYIKEVRYSGASNKGPFTIQVGSFRELPNANRMKAALEFKYSRVYILETEINGDKYFRVRLGRFNVKDDVYRLAKTLAEEGYGTLITHYDERI